MTYGPDDSLDQLDPNGIVSFSLGLTRSGYPRYSVSARTGSTLKALHQSRFVALNEITDATPTGLVLCVSIATPG